MTETVLRSLVEQHSCEVLGTRYSLRLEWVASEQSDAPAARHLLRVEYSAVAETTKAPMQLHLLVSLTEMSDLPRLLDDALQYSLLGQKIAAAPERPWSARLQQSLGALCAAAKVPGWRGSRATQ